MISQFCEESKPERIVLHTCSHTRVPTNPRMASVSLSGIIGEEPLIFVSEQVWSRIFLFLFAQTTLTAVAGNIAAADGEFVAGQTASCWYIRDIWSMEVEYCSSSICSLVSMVVF